MSDVSVFFLFFFFFFYKKKRVEKRDSTPYLWASFIFQFVSAETFPVQLIVHKSVLHQNVRP